MVMWMTSFTCAYNKNFIMIKWPSGVAEDTGQLCAGSGTVRGPSCSRGGGSGHRSPAAGLGAFSRRVCRASPTWPRPPPAAPLLPLTRRGLLGDAVGLSHAEPAARLISGGLFWVLAYHFMSSHVSALWHQRCLCVPVIAGFLIPSLSCLFLRSMWLGAM